MLTFKAPVSYKTKTDMRVLFAVFYSSTETFSLYTSGKVVRCETLDVALHIFHLQTISSQLCCKMSFVTSAMAAVMRDLS
jgi:hypothetical protein